MRWRTVRRRTLCGEYWTFYSGENADECLRCLTDDMTRTALFRWGFFFLRFSWRSWQLTMASFRHNQILRISVRSCECRSSVCAPITPVLKSFSFSPQFLQQLFFLLFCCLSLFVYVFEFLSSIKTRSNFCGNKWLNGQKRHSFLRSNEEKYKCKPQGNG